MPTPPMSDAQCIEALLAVREHGSQLAASEALGIPRGTLQGRLREGVRRQLAPIIVPTGDALPDRSLPIEDIIAHRERAFEARHAHKKAKLWRRFSVPTRGPYALMFFGDPHLDDDGCNLSLFKAHAELSATTPHLYAVNIGDTTNNWTGRLARLWADQDTSAETARQIARHYLVDSGIPWFLWLHGNHDLWDGPVGKEFFSGVCPEFVAMEDWQAKVTLVSPNGHELRLWAQHNFKGSSIWNNMHGLERAAQMQDWAHIYVSGHHHDAGYRQGENPFRRFVYNLLRVRGYKFDDSYADHHGFGEYQHGAAAVAVIDPDANKLNAVTCFLDPHEGADFLAWKRARLAA